MSGVEQTVIDMSHLVAVGIGVVVSQLFTALRRARERRKPAAPLPEAASDTPVAAPVPAKPDNKLPLILLEEDGGGAFDFAVQVYGDRVAGMDDSAAVTMAIREWRLAGAPMIHTAVTGLQVHCMMLRRSNQED